MIRLGPVELDEDVGHDITRSSEPRARTPEAIYDSMRQNIKDGPELSVNRVSAAEKRGEITDLVNIILQRGTSGKRRFQGWGMLPVKEITNRGFKVQADPAPAIGQMPENPYHALILLPQTALADENERNQHIRYLSELAAGNWNPRP